MTEIEMTSFLISLANNGVTGIKVKYDGSGDSGAIDWIGYTCDPCASPEDVCDNIDDWADEANLATLDQDAYKTIETFAESKLLDDIEDWWNNEGGFGELCICVPSGKYIINNHVRIIETEDYFHNGSLLEKSEKE